MSHIKYYPELEQGSDEWLQARCGILTASEMKLILTPTLKVTSNEKERTHLFELLSQRISQYVDPVFIGFNGDRGHQEEVLAKIKYIEHVAPIQDMGFITNDKYGFTIGYSPDGLVGDDGLVECKSRVQKYQVQTIAELEVPEEHVFQLQTGLIVSERKWIDYISYCGGHLMCVLRVFPDLVIQEAIINAAIKFEQRLQLKWEQYKDVVNNKKAILIPTERTKIEQEIIIWRI